MCNQNKKDPIALYGAMGKGDEKERVGVGDGNQLSRYGSWHKNLMLSSRSGCSVEEYRGASGSLRLGGLIQYLSCGSVTRA